MQWTEFSPYTAAAGGLLIGAAAVLLQRINGRIAGISGILYGAFGRSADDRAWRVFFVAGLVAGGFVFQVLSGQPLLTRADYSVILLVAGGLLVGMGTRLGSGCTSGHGVCGLARLSRRSFVATAAFLSTGVLTATGINVLRSLL